MFIDNVMFFGGRGRTAPLGTPLNILSICAINTIIHYSVDISLKVPSYSQNMDSSNLNILEESALNGGT